MLLAHASELDEPVTHSRCVAGGFGEDRGHEGVEFHGGLDLERSQRCGLCLSINNSTVTFVDLTASSDELLEANLIMPEPCPFLNRSFPVCSIARPTETKGAAMGALKALAGDGLFIGQTNEFMQLLNDLATDADQAESNDK